MSAPSLHLSAKRRVAALVLDPLSYLLRIEDCQAIKASAPVDALQRLPVANASRMGVQDQPVHAAAFLLFGAMVALE